jgi:hypothetical protein
MKRSAPESSSSSRLQKRPAYVPDRDALAARVGGDFDRLTPDLVRHVVLPLDCPERLPPTAWDDTWRSLSVVSHGARAYVAACLSGALNRLTTTADGRPPAYWPRPLLMLALLLRDPGLEAAWQAELPWMQYAAAMSGEERRERDLGMPAYVHRHPRRPPAFSCPAALGRLQWLAAVRGLKTLSACARELPRIVAPYRTAQGAVALPPLLAVQPPAFALARLLQLGYGNLGSTEMYVVHAFMMTWCKSHVPSLRRALRWLAHACRLSPSAVHSCCRLLELCGYVDHGDFLATWREAAEAAAAGQ